MSVTASREPECNLGRELAEFERRWKTGTLRNPLPVWYDWLMSLWDQVPDDIEDPTWNRLNRLQGEVEAAMEGQP